MRAQKLFCLTKHFQQSGQGVLMDAELKRELEKKDQELEKKNKELLRFKQHLIELNEQLTNEVISHEQQIEKLRNQISDSQEIDSLKAKLQETSETADSYLVNMENLKTALMLNEASAKSELARIQEKHQRIIDELTEENNKLKRSIEDNRVCDKDLFEKTLHDLNSRNILIDSLVEEINELKLKNKRNEVISKELIRNLLTKYFESKSLEVLKVIANVLEFDESQKAAIGANDTTPISDQWISFLLRESV